ncbi:TadE/TadG family type IV pilus assembly protein [Tritonibacter scottomollicae]|uniref:TadE/TadG family type IV pilus assembly protein n=1 Tax=Tritonibacter scottomollicae TaxID=483013 RepID=A0ABZ0HKX5_TRISK|nr:TadE/TadG family type IV pilus assembly protein [Tritonibacter scottomollicae]WOI35097.1 TadE/TadG family type IV pilus assembly protein [Tritonibacter scottomollicae]
MFKMLSDTLRRFRHREDGNIAIETAIYLPFLLGVFAVTFTLFDLFRQETVNTKAAYTVSDLISRETTALNDEYINSIYTLGRMMARANSGMSMRVSVIRWDADDARYYVDWSVERGAQMDIWTDATVVDIEDKLPTMPDEERIIVVETWNDVEPAFNVGLGTRNIYNLVFSRPRFASQIAFEGSVVSDGTIHDDEVVDNAES